MDKLSKSYTQRYVLFCFAWALAYCGISLATQFQLLSNPITTGLLVAGMVLLALIVIRSYLKVFNQLDEMFQRIQLEGFALAFGISFFLILIYAPFQKIGAPEITSDTAIVVLSFSMGLGLFLAKRKIDEK